MSGALEIGHVEGTGRSEEERDLRDQKRARAKREAKLSRARNVWTRGESMLSSIRAKEKARACGTAEKPKKR